MLTSDLLAQKTPRLEEKSEFLRFKVLFLDLRHIYVLFFQLEQSKYI